MRKFLCLLAAFLYFVVITAYSQTKEISGKVTDATGSPIPWATIKIKGAKTGTSADANGLFKINTPPNATLVVSGIGFETIEVSVANQQSLTISLKLGNTPLGKVVVTALDIRSEKKALGFAVRLLSVRFGIKA